MTKVECDSCGAVEEEMQCFILCTKCQLDEAPDPESLKNQFKLLRMQYTQNMSELKAELEIMKKRGARTEKLMKEIYAFLLPDKPTDAMTLHQLKDGYKSRGWKILNLTKEVKDLKSRKSVIWM